MSDYKNAFRYECLGRSRMAKHEVLSRVLRRKVTGKWLDGAGFIYVQREEITPALRTLRLLREKLNDESVRSDEGTTAFLEHFPDIDVGYDKRKKIHFVVIPSAESY